MTLGMRLGVRSRLRAWRATAQARYRAWWENRLVAQDTLTLELRHVYILPTRMGLMFAALLVVLLLASVGYQSNLSYLLTFLLASTAISAMFMTTHVLRGLRLQLQAPQPGFAQQPLKLNMFFTAANSQPHYAVGVRWHDAIDEQSTWVDVGVTTGTHVELVWTPAKRGWQPLPWVVVHAHFPLGIFRAWSVWRLASSVLWCFSYPI